ncbi:MAG: RNA polymerase sigma-70 factor (ECF subfamily) [Glaciecola sp.]
MFNEGLNIQQHQAKEANIMSIEALNLADMLLKKYRDWLTGSHSLVALMHLYLARQKSRCDDNGILIPLNLQDRALWKNKHTMLGTAELSHALEVKGELDRPYLYEALIAHEHLRASDLMKTDWPAIELHYRKWLRVSPLPMVELNLAIPMVNSINPFG